MTSSLVLSTSVVPSVRRSQALGHMFTFLEGIMPGYNGSAPEQYGVGNAGRGRRRRSGWSVSKSTWKEKTKTSGTGHLQICDFVHCLLCLLALNGLLCRKLSVGKSLRLRVKGHSVHYINFCWCVCQLVTITFVIVSPGMALHPSCVLHVRELSASLPVEMRHSSRSFTIGMLWHQFPSLREIWRNCLEP